MSTNSRICPDCGAAVEGRPNKIFCNGVCKGRHFRNLASTEHTDEDPKSAELPQAPSPHYYPTNKVAVEQDEIHDEAAEGVQADQQQASALHAQFGTLVREMLEFAGSTVNARRIRNLLSEAARLSVSYAAHPYRKLYPRQIKDRLKALYDMHDTFREAADGVWGSRTTSFEVEKQWRKQLRKLLIED